MELDNKDYATHKVMKYINKLKENNNAEKNKVYSKKLKQWIDVMVGGRVTRLQINKFKSLLDNNREFAEIYRQITPNSPIQNKNWMTQLFAIYNGLGNYGRRYYDKDRVDMGRDNQLLVLKSIEQIEEIVNILNPGVSRQPQYGTTHPIHPTPEQIAKFNHMFYTEEFIKLRKQRYSLMNKITYLKIKEAELNLGRRYEYADNDNGRMLKEITQMKQSELLPLITSIDCRTVYGNRICNIDRARLESTKLRIETQLDEQLEEILYFYNNNNTYERMLRITKNITIDKHKLNILMVNTAVNTGKLMQTIDSRNLDTRSFV
jgi:hypothetical protein